MGTQGTIHGKLSCKFCNNFTYKQVTRNLYEELKDHT